MLGNRILNPDTRPNGILGRIAELGWCEMRGPSQAGPQTGSLVWQEIGRAQTGLIRKVCCDDDDRPARWRGGSTSQRPESGQIQPVDPPGLLTKSAMFRREERLARHS